MLLSRVDRLPAETRRLLQEAAVLGAAFDEALLHAVATAPQTVRGGARSSSSRRICSSSVDLAGRGRYRFTHALVHEVVYQNLLVARRTELHERAGRVLERAVGAHPERLSDIEALGHHWSLAPTSSAARVT